MLPLLFLLLLLPPPATPTTPPPAPHLLLNIDFPDPTLLHDPLTHLWHAFATASGPLPLQAASAPSPLGPWTHHPSLALLASPAPWTTGLHSWAPSVHRLSTRANSYILYFSGQHANHTSLHCIGAAVSHTGPLGPYVPDAEPFECPLEHGGAIDPTSVVDGRTGERWVAWKVDGNAVGGGGYCGNSVAPVTGTPIEMVRVDGGRRKKGEVVRVWDREEGVDGPLVEAPEFWDTGTGEWVLFFREI
ncbi:glycosyl hydrolase [Schizothecium vesticola]|uniref:Glycosyl hydrolase n=1 Tax=Schizothecium vesticola TaxID=314040 RepID=A0AA40F6U9_9PEZI|nr:glycosyl hydrolase [Schizothecium vesticola]